MNPEQLGHFRGLALKLAALLLVIGFSGAQVSAPAGQAAVPTAAQRFKNIQVLKDIPADRVIPAMNFIAASLNVDCSFCHVDGPDFDKDEKKEKKTARKMMQMELAINQTNFNNETAVTCNTCHRGSRNPVASPLLKAAKQTPGTAPPSASAAGAAQIIEKYVQALGGKQAIENIASFAEKGFYSSSIMPGSFPFEVLSKAPGQRIEILHYPEGDSLSAYHDHAGWVKSSRGPAYSMSAAAADYFSYFADIHSAVHMQQIFTKFRMAPPEKIGARTANVVAGLQRDQEPVTFYFDQQTGLLLRMVRYTQTPLGPNPIQADYADYRVIGETKIPFRRTFTQSGFQYTIQIKQFQLNVPLDDSKFTKPM